MASAAPAASESQDHIASLSEVTPLLSDSNNSQSSSTTSTVANDTAHDGDSEGTFAASQILLLCFAHLIEPVAFFSIFPFINQMSAENGNLTPADTGFYSGLIESLFSLTQMCVMIIWGRLADRYGRKPILVISLVGCAVSAALFGFAKTIWQMILFRCLAGVFAGTVVTIRTMISELSTVSTQAKAFSWFAFAGNMGILFGPLIGGALAEPNKQYPRVFHDSAFFEKYPYGLATMVTGSISAISAVLTYFFVGETLGIKEHTTSAVQAGSFVDEEQETSGVWSLVSTPGVAPVLYIYGHVMLLAFSYTALLPVWYYEPISLGGFGFSSLRISFFLALIGFAQAVWLLLIFPPLHRRVGTGGVLRWCAGFYPLFFIICPILSELLRQRKEVLTIVFWVLAPTHTIVGVGVSMAFTGVQLALNDISPSPAKLGELNAVALTILSGLRAVSPAAFTSLYAISVKKQILHGYMIWIVMIALGAGFTLAVRWLPEKAEGRPDKAYGKKNQNNGTA